MGSRKDRGVPAISRNMQRMNPVSAISGGRFNLTSMSTSNILQNGFFLLHYGELVGIRIINDDVTKWAFNANFERVCLSRNLADLGLSLDPFHDRHPLSTDCARFLNPAGWRCTMVWSAYLGLPLSLAGAGALLGLDKQKMAEGKDLIRYFCQPCAPSKTNGGRTRNLPSHDPQKWETLSEARKSGNGWNLMAEIL